MSSKTSLAESRLWIFLDFIDWAFLIAGVVLCRRAWRLARESRQILPPDGQSTSSGATVWSRGSLAIAGVYTLVLFGLVMVERYHTSALLLQPGVDPRREHEAMLAMNVGASQAQRGDLVAADKSFQKALVIWEQLTVSARTSVPTRYKANLAMTLYDLGWVREKQNHLEEAEQYYSRALAIADSLPGDQMLDDQFKRNMADARQALAHFGGGKAAKVLDDKDRVASRKYEEAHVKADRGEAAAEDLYSEAISLWEEVLAQETDDKHRSADIARLAAACLLLGELQVRKGKHLTAEQTLRKAVRYGREAMDREPDRPLIRHNLDVARRTLDGLLERAFLQEFTELSDAGRYADAVNACLRGIESQEEQLRMGKDRETAERSLAFRLNRLAWLLAHCPDGTVRDTKVAVRHARRATQVQPDVGDYWYTFATAQYRNGDWKDSLAALEKLKAKEGGFDASAWLLVAMNRHRLKQRDQALEALHKADQWIEERQKHAETDTRLRIQLEMAWPALEFLRREAEDLIQGKDPANRRLG
jgi:tetratricopeptide (TPR) repeat protein